MKRIMAGIAGILLSAVALAATTVAPQLISPTGSTSGQVIKSNGPSSAPTWGNVAATTLAAQTANTVVGNGTGSSASPTALSVPSCSTSASALNWTSGTGFSCNTAVNAAQLGGATFASPGAIGGTTPGSGAFTALSSTGNFTPSQTNGIVGTTTNNNANAGSIGEYQTATTTATSATSGAALNATSVSLTAGDWDVQCLLQTNPAGTTNTTSVNVGVSTTSATFQNITGGFVNATVLNYNVNQAGVQTDVTSPLTRVSLSGTTTTYCVAQVNFNTSTMTVHGFIRARRVR